MNENNAYSAIARVYDKLNSEIDYERWAGFIQECFDKFLDKRPELVLDLACGTGSMTRAMAERGYDMIGIDASEDMLSVALSRSSQENDGQRDILYLLQDMRSFELYGTVGAVLCCLDSMNYLLSEDDLRATLRLVHNYLDPDGLFVFDVNTPYKFENVYANNAYILEDEITEEYGDGETESYSVYCGWQNEYDEQSGICDFYLSLFEETESGYSRSDEHQRERCYSRQTLELLLGECGFESLGFFGDHSFGSPAEDCQRWYVCARAKK